MIKILATIGPKSNNLECINFAKTTNLFRLNGSHEIEYAAAVVHTQFVLMLSNGYSCKPGQIIVKVFQLKNRSYFVKHSNNELLAVDD